MASLRLERFAEKKLLTNRLIWSHKSLLAVSARRAEAEEGDVVHLDGKIVFVFDRAKELAQHLVRQLGAVFTVAADEVVVWLGSGDLVAKAAVHQLRYRNDSLLAEKVQRAVYRCLVKRRRDFADVRVYFFRCDVSTQRAYSVQNKLALWRDAITGFTQLCRDAFHVVTHNKPCLLQIFAVAT